MKWASKNVFLLLFVGACFSQREPPLAAGDGLTLTKTEKGRTLSVNPDQVPLAPSCNAGQIVVRSETGWACTDPTPLCDSGTADRLKAIEAKMTVLETQVGDLTRERIQLSTLVSAVETQLGRYADDNQKLPFSIAAVTCAVRESDTARVDVAGESVHHAAGVTGAVVFYCPVFAVTHTPSWGVLDVELQDPDGAANGAKITAVLISVDDAGIVSRLVTIDSNTSQSNRLGSLAMPLPTDLDFSHRYHFVELTLERTDEALEPKVVGLRLRP